MTFRCAFEQGPMPHEWHMAGPCEGQLQAHHCIPKATLKSTYGWWDHLRKVGEWRDGMPETLPDLQDVLADRRNLLPLCERHHELVSNRRIYVTPTMLPEGIDSFAQEVGVSWYLERFFYREGEVA